MLIPNNVLMCIIGQYYVNMHVVLPVRSINVILNAKKIFPTCGLSYGSVSGTVTFGYFGILLF